jgi:hypothetical protein
MKPTSFIFNSAVLSGPTMSVLVLSFVVSSYGAAAPGATAPEPKTHTLFMGADLDLQVAGDLCRVQDVSGDSFVVSANGSERLIPVKKGLIDLKIQQSLKLTDLSATIANLKGERAYTPENDPNKKFARAQSGTSGQDLVGQADGFSLNTSGSLAMIAQIKDPKQIAAGVPAAAVAGMARLRQNADNAGIVSQYGETNNVGNYVAQMERELALQLFDAMDVTFEVSSEKPLVRPYVVIIARYHERDANQGKVRTWICAKAIPPVDNTPQKVHLVQGGFPPGFIMDGFKVHLFDRGRELETNVAENRVELTYNDAFKYALLDYKGAHKGASLPAAPVMGKLPAGWHTRLTADQLSQPYFIKVSKDGMPLGAYADEACSQPVADPYLQSVVKEIRFMPSLEKGKAVEGTTKLRLGDIQI